MKYITFDEGRPLELIEPVRNLQWGKAHFNQHTGVGVTKLVEATNGHFLVEAENEIWYNIASGYGFCRSLFY